MGIFSGWHLFIVLLIVLVVFGAGKLPNVMRDLGRGVKSFKEAMSDNKEAEVAEPQPTPRPTIEGEVKKNS
ncbi:Sec-independent protein translocase subunit TatA [Candidatus Magnetaquicoccus inordinatus]|uniref:Sec-independent protein translocase subunit TatA n=1 Tax=Candidatus Magnetaquicoccus inordinatus TaxID=2496818 RepID=UPI00102B1DB9|nr:Sec-independent protein translocase subunit TatA [Candidatus Magnetaquicoccus inordinatus]